MNKRETRERLEELLKEREMIDSEAALRGMRKMFDENIEEDDDIREMDKFLDNNSEMLELAMKLRKKRRME